MLAVSTDAFFQDAEVFRAICTSLYDGDLGDLVSGGIENLTLPEILWAVYEVGILREDDPEMSPGVLNVIEQEIRNEAEEIDDEEEVKPYYDRFVESAKADLEQQLVALGVSPADLIKIM